MRSIWFSIVGIGAGLALISTAFAQAEPVRAGLPQIPIQVPKPAIPGKELGELRNRRPEGLAALALAHSKQANHQAAIHLQYWAVVNSGGDAGLYNLACFYALDEQVDASIYWLQQAAIREGVDSVWVAKDTDLAIVRRDPRWPKIAQFLEACGNYWQQTDIFETSLVVPAGYDGQRVLPLLIGLHGMGSRAKSFVDEDLQEFADKLDMAFLAVSGTQPQGPTSFHWSEDANRDLAHIDRALKKLASQLKVDRSRVALFGFSQGGMMAIEIAARHPDRFCGAISLSPGGIGDVALATVKATDAHQRQGYVVIYGGKEAAGNVRMAQEYVRQTERLQARVQDKPYPDKSTHSYPLDFYALLPSWIKYVYDE